jgi:hypothetical protein
MSGVFSMALSLAVTVLPPEAPTFHGKVESIIQKHCQDCHRPGQVAPFSLLTYEQARKRGDDLVNVIEDRLMPPWHASTTIGGPFKDARVLSDDERKAVTDWVAAGCPQGDPKTAPPAREFTSDWPLGPPDLVLTAQPYTLAAEGPDEFRVFVIPSGLTEGKWIKSVDFKPGNRKVVHHILSAFDTRRLARSLDEKDPEAGYHSVGGFGRLPSGLPMIPSGTLGGWAPGKAPRPLPARVGRYIPAEADVLLQIHYHRNGKTETDATSIGLYFAEESIDKQVRGGMILPDRAPGVFRPSLSIPAGSADHEVRGSMTIPYDVHMTALVPHMHWLGKDMKIDARLPDGTVKTLILVDRWDFNWQDTYDLAEPVAIPKGTVLEMVAHFDNSASNPANPSNPPIDVHWGEQTTDEMCIGFLQMTRDDEHLDGKTPTAAPLSINFDSPEGRIRRQLLLRLRGRGFDAKAAPE